MSITGGYTINHGPAYAGMVADNEPYNIVSKLNTTANVIPFGKGVVASGEDGITVATAGSTAVDFVGVAAYTLNRAYNQGEAFGAQAKMTADIATMGVVWVKAAEAVTARDAVFLRVGATDTGDFSNAAGTGATLSVQIPNAKFLGTAAKGELVKISFVVGG